VPRNIGRRKAGLGDRLGHGPLTLAQLHSFVTVARLGSVKAAAEALSVSEPAVSGAVAALRRDLGDELFVRAGGGIVLTPGGRQLAALAAEMVGLADRARRVVREARGEATLLRVAATATVGEYVAAPLLDAFTRRARHVEISLGVEPAAGFAQLLTERRADVTLGPRAATDASLGLESVPFLRYRLVVVAGRRHPLSGRRSIPPTVLAGERWLVGAGGAEGQLEDFFGRHGLEPELRAFPSHAAALAAVAAGQGLSLAVAHTVLDELRRGTLVSLDVPGTPFDGLWHATTLGKDRRSPAAWSLRRFVTTPEATQAMLARSSGVPAGRFRPAVYVTLWSEG
jgi:LysR family transcriptional regulator, low CO2-responsive transcriptional regulator